MSLKLVGYMTVSHFFTQSFAFLLNTAKSFELHWFSGRGQTRQCCIVWSSSPHSQVVWPGSKPHLAMAAFDRPVPVLSRLSVFHWTHGASESGGRASEGGIPISVGGGSSSSRFVHSWSLFSSPDVVRGWTWLRKFLLDFSPWA